MRSWALTVLLLFITGTAIAATPPVEVPAGFVTVGEYGPAGPRMWFSPASIEYYDEYISVDTFMIAPNLDKVAPGARYITNTTRFKPGEKLRCETHVTFHAADGQQLSVRYNSLWKKMNESDRGSLGWQLYEKVIQTIAAKGLRPQPAPFYLAAELQLFAANPGFSHASFDPATIRVVDDYVVVDCFTVYKKPYKDVKYIKQTVSMKPVEMAMMVGDAIFFGEEGRVVRAVPAAAEWQPILPGSVTLLLLAELTDYCQENGIALPQ